MEKTTKICKQEYLEFLENIPRNLEKLKTLLDFKHDVFKHDEINKSVIFYHDHYKNPSAVGLSSKELENLVDTYWGEAFKHYKGGEWALNLSKTDEAYCTPTIEKWGGENYPWSRISPKVWRIRVQKFGLSDMLPATYIYEI